MFSPTKPSKTNQEKKWVAVVAGTFIDKATLRRLLRWIAFQRRCLAPGSGTRFMCSYRWVAGLYFVLAIKFHLPLFRLAIVLVCWKYRSGHRQSLTPSRNMLFEGRTPQRSPASTFSSVFFGRLLFGTWLKQLQKKPQDNTVHSISSKTGTPPHSHAGFWDLRHHWHWRLRDYRGLLPRDAWAKGWPGRTLFCFVLHLFVFSLFIVLVSWQSLILFGGLESIAGILPQTSLGILNDT